MYPFYIMLKLSRNKIRKLLNGKSQSIKEKSKKKGPAGRKSNKSFRKKRSINLRNNSLKNRVILGGGEGDGDEYNEWEKKKIEEDTSFKPLDDVKNK